MIKNPFCRPRLRAGAVAAGKSTLSLLDRIREAVFRFVMFSALSKGGASRSRDCHAPSDFGYYPNDPQHSEAVADCIEFLKRSAATEAGECDSTAGYVNEV